MSLRTTLIGFLGGLAAASSLYYPLYVVFPARYVPGWQGGDERLAWMGIGLTALLLLLTGFLAGWLSPEPRRARRGLSGAAAGLLAASLAFCTYGAPAAGVYACRALLAHGYAPAMDEAQYLYLVAEPVINVIYLVYLGWLALGLSGMLLGFLGGLASPRLPLAEWALTDESPAEALGFRWTAFLFGLILALVHLVLYALLTETARQPIEEYSLAVTFPVVGVSLIPMLTGLLAAFLTSGWLAWGLERIRRTEPPCHLRLYAAAVAAAVSAFWALALAIPQTFSYLALPWQIVLFSVRLLPAACLAWLTWRLYGRLRTAFPEQKTPPAWLPVVWAFLPAVFVGVFGLMSTWFLPTMPTASFLTYLPRLALVLAITAGYLWLATWLTKRAAGFTAALSATPTRPFLLDLKGLASLGLRITIWGGVLTALSVAPSLIIVLVIIPAIAPLMVSSTYAASAAAETGLLESIQSIYTVTGVAGAFSVAAGAGLWVCLMLAFSGWLLRQIKLQSPTAQPEESQ